MLDSLARKRRPQEPSVSIQGPNPRMEKAQKQVYEHNIMYYLFDSHVRMILNQYCSFNILRYQTRYHQSRLRKEYMYNPIQ